MKTTRRQFLKNSVVLTAATACATSSQLVMAKDVQSLEIGSEPQFFLDDWITEHSEGLTRTLHQPAKQGLIKESDGSDWLQGGVYHGKIVCRDNAGKFHMTYRYMWWDPALEKIVGADKAHWQHDLIGYATSDDGIRWSKPNLGLVDAPAEYRKQADFPFEMPARMSRDNNFGCPIDFIYDLHAHGNVSDPTKRFLLRVARRDSTIVTAKIIESKLYYAADWPDFARDPHWLDKLTPIPDAKLSPRGFPLLAGFDDSAGEWFVTGQDRLPNWLKRGGRDIARFSSPDLVHWHGPELVLPVANDELRQPDHWIEYMDQQTYRVGGPKSGVWLGQLVVFDSDRSSDQYMVATIPNGWRKGLTELRLVISRDAGRSWQRVGGKQTWLPHHQDEHGFDRLVFATLPVRTDDELRFYYTAYDGDHLVFYKDGTMFHKDRIRAERTALATLRLDGYMSLDAGNTAGELLTKPLRFAGDKLTVNLAAPHGTLRVELQDESGHPLKGFAADDCLPIIGDGVGLVVRWKDGAEIRKLADQPVRARFLLQNGSLYAFQFA